MGMGKSTAAAAFRRARIPVFDADAAVHRLQAKGGRAIRAIEAAFPGTIRDGAVDRPALRQAVLGKPEALTRLEHILHPMVEAEERAFIARARRAGKPAVVLDIPLLFETGADRRVDIDRRRLRAAADTDLSCRPAPAHEPSGYRGGDRQADAGPGEAAAGRCGGADGLVAKSHPQGAEPVHPRDRLCQFRHIGWACAKTLHSIQTSGIDASYSQRLYFYRGKRRQ